MCQREQKEQYGADRSRLSIGKDRQTHGLTTLRHMSSAAEQRDIASLVVGRSHDLAENCLAAGDFRPMRKFIRISTDGPVISSAQPARLLAAMLPSVVGVQTAPHLSD